MIDLEERIQRYTDELTAGAPPVTVDDVIYGPTPRRAGFEPARLLMVAAVVGLAITGGVVLLASRSDESPDRPVDAPATTAGTPTATVSPSTAASTAPAGSGPPAQSTLPTHAEFMRYVAAAEAVFGPVEVGASCDDWPDIPSAALDDLVVFPAVTDTNPCRVLGWAYFQADGVAELPASITENGHYVEGAIYDEVGNVIGYVSK